MTNRSCLSLGDDVFLVHDVASLSRVERVKRFVLAQAPAGP